MKRREPKLTIAGVRAPRSSYSLRGNTLTLKQPVGSHDHPVAIAITYDAPIQEETRP